MKNSNVTLRIGAFIASAAFLATPLVSTSGSDDFVSGGGKITITNDVTATFAVVGGLKSDELWGSLNYKQSDIHVKGSDVATYSALTNLISLSYSAKLNGAAGYIAEVTLTTDLTSFQIRVKDTTVTNTPVIYEANGSVNSGNIVHHTEAE